MKTRILAIKKQNMIVRHGELRYCFHDFGSNNLYNFKRFSNEIKRLRKKDFLKMIQIANKHQIFIAHTEARK